jgi:hypothetical protein
LGVLVGLVVGVDVAVGVAVGVFVAPGKGVWVAVGVAVGSTGQVVWLNGKLNVSFGNVPACPATWIATFGSKLATVMLNTSEAPFLKLLNFGWNMMLVKPGFPLAPVQVTL